MHKHVTSTMSLLLSLLIILQIPATKSDFIQNECSNDRYKANSAFQANLNTLFSSLNSAATSSGFATGTVGRDPDKVYGLALCHGDLSPSDCKSCIYNSIQDIEFRCPFDMSAMVWYDDCSLRYSNTSFFSILEYSSEYCTSNSANAEKPQLFKKILGLLMDNLTAEVVYGSAQMFATEVVNVTGVTKIYGLAQCTRDLSEQQCTNCLVNFVDKIRSCCTGSTGCRVFGHSCYIRYEVYPFFNLLLRKNETAPHASPSSGPVRAAPPPPTSPHFSSAPPGGSRGGSDGTTRTVIIMLAISSATASLVLFISCIFFLTRKPVKRSPVIDILNGGDEEEMRNAESLMFDLSTLKAATNDFSAANKLGEGGFGPVYKGTVLGGHEIAVKRLSRGSMQGLVELRNEVVLVAKLQHRNLVRLMGCCLEAEENLLVYEYLPNRSLDKFLFNSARRGLLDWVTRYKIIEGIGRGLLYLHEDSRLRIIHRDLKASNILLDGDMNPKISDFGLARLFDRDMTQNNTSRIAGTYGYMAPEYAMHGFFSTKSDVFSYGVLVLEIVTGRTNAHYQESIHSENLLTYVWHNWGQETPIQVLDRSLTNRCRPQDVIRCIHIALLCVQEDPLVRPSMASVILMLSSPSFTLPAPSTPAFVISRNITNNPDVLETHANAELRWSTPEVVSGNNGSVSELEPR